MYIEKSSGPKTEPYGTPCLLVRVSDIEFLMETYGVVEKKQNFMGPFYGWGSTASRLEPLRGGSLLFTTKFPEISGTHFTDLGRMKG